MHITVGPGLDNAEKHDLFNGCSGKWMRGRSTDAPRCMETPGATVRFGIVPRQKAIYAVERLLGCTWSTCAASLNPFVVQYRMRQRMSFDNVC
jgi:hypothetical protein